MNITEQTAPRAQMTLGADLERDRLAADFQHELDAVRERLTVTLHE